MIRTTRTLDVLYVGTLPPHQGGSAVTGVQFLAGLERQGHSVRAIAPITAAAAGDGAFERAVLADVRRYRVSHFETSPDVAPAPQYEQAEFDQIETLFEEARMSSSVAESRSPSRSLSSRAGTASRGCREWRGRRWPAFFAARTPPTQRHAFSRGFVRRGGGRAGATHGSCS
jgi:hypothetical protein